MGKTYKKEKQPKAKPLKEKSHKIKNFKYYLEEMLDEEDLAKPQPKKK